MTSEIEHERAASKTLDIKRIDHISMLNEKLHEALNQRDDAIAALAQVNADNARDAARWRAMLDSQRIRMIGSAGIIRPEANNYAHFGMEIWTKYGTSLNPVQLEQMRVGNEQGIDWLTKYADIAIAATADIKST